MKTNNLLSDLNERYTRNFTDVNEAFEFLLNQKEKYNVEFVSGKGDLINPP